MFKWMFPEMSTEEASKIIAAGVAEGVNWFDTAELYGWGRSELLLARALRANDVPDEEVVITTKWWPFPRRAGNIPKTIDDRLKYLDGYSIDQYLVHQPISFSTPEAEMDEMAALVEAGKIKTVGVSNFSAERMRQAHAALAKHGLPMTANQVEYSLLNRKIESNGVLDAAKELGITIVCWGPLASGLLSGNFHRDPAVLASRPLGRRFRLGGQIEESRPVVEALIEIGEKYDATPAQVALNWLIHFHGETVVAIPGASKVKHAEESAGAMRFRLDEADMARLDELTRKYR